MITKYFDVNAPGHSIRCKLYCNTLRGFDKLVICGHGFGGHKDNKAMEKYAERTLSKYKNVAVLVFDWPVHGNDVKKKLTLADCYSYVDLICDYVKENFHVADLYVYATSFGGFVFLSYLLQNGNPFRKLAFRCPAVKMYESMAASILQDGDMEKLEKGKEVLAGFDRKIKITQQFLDELKEKDIFSEPFFDYADDVFIVHGTKDEIIPFEQVQSFSENNCIEFLPIEKADHRFQDPYTMDIAIQAVNRFFTFE